MATEFTYQAFSSTGLNPAPLTFSLSAASNSVVLDTAGTVDGKTVRGIVFNDTTITSANSALVTLSAFNGTSFRVARAYNGAQFAFVFTDRTSSLFTVATGTVVQTLATPTENTITYPELRRLWALEAI